MSASMTVEQVSPSIGHSQGTFLGQWVLVNSLAELLGLGTSSFERVS